MYSARTGETQCLLWFIGLASRQSLLSSDLAAQAPSSTMIMKKSFPLLRAIGLSAGLIASAAMMAPAQAATSGTITATGTVPATCSVNGASISMSPTSTSNSALSGKSSAVAISTNGTATNFTLSSPTVVSKPPGSTLTTSNVVLIADLAGGTGSFTAGGTSFTQPSPLSSTVTFTATVGDPVSSTPLTPGNYSISSTLTCVN